jgi:thioredoxin 1
MAKPLEITDDTFQNEVLDSDQPVLVDFWADWCGPCRMIAPSVEQIAADYDGKIKVGKVDVDDNPAIPGRYGIVGIPTLMLFKNGEVVERITGALPKDAILAKVLPHV